MEAILTVQQKTVYLGEIVITNLKVTVKSKHNNKIQLCGKFTEEQPNI